MLQRAADACGHGFRFLDAHVGKVKRPEDDGLAGQFFKNGAVELRLRGFDRYLADRRTAELRQERISLRPHVNDGGIAETNVDRGWPFHAVQCGVECLEAEFARLLRPRLHVGLVNLNNVGAGGEQIFDLGVYCVGVVQRHLFFVLVEIVLRLL